MLTKFATGPWVEITVSDGRRLSGILEEFSSDIETETVDLYVGRPAWIGSGSVVLSLGDVAGVWVPRSEVKSMVVVKAS